MQVYAINGWRDHVHLTVSIPPKHSVSYAVKKLKGSSSHHINQLGVIDQRFAWQRGYGVLTVGERHRETAISYVQRQKDHHHQHTNNRWLDRTDEYDDGPPDSDLEDVPTNASHLRETAPQYVTSESDTIPF